MLNFLTVSIVLWLCKTMFSLLGNTEILAKRDETANCSNGPEKLCTTYTRTHTEWSFANEAKTNNGDSGAKISMSSLCNSWQFFLEVWKYIQKESHRKVSHNVWIHFLRPRWVGPHLRDDTIPPRWDGPLNILCHRTSWASTSCDSSPRWQTGGAGRPCSSPPCRPLTRLCSFCFTGPFASLVFRAVSLHFCSASTPLGQQQCLLLLGDLSSLSAATLPPGCAARPMDQVCVWSILGDRGRDTTWIISPQGDKSLSLPPWL